jgi:hypothetical protein
MAKPGLLSPLQLTGGQGLLDNTVLTGSSEFNAAAASYTGISFISDLMTAISLAPGANVSEPTLESLRSLGTSICPSLGNSIPAEFAGQDPFPAVAENGYVELLQSIGEGYLGGGDSSKFAQAFAAAQGYCSLANQFILSALDANEYLGPTFTNLEDMITGDLSKVSTNLPVFGDDLVDLGFLISLPKLANLGEPATLIQNLAEQTNSNKLLPCVDVALQSVGLTPSEIQDLITNNRASLFNPNGLTSNQFDRLQQKAFLGLTLVGGDCLDQVLEILEVDLPVESMADLLDPATILPNSFQTLLYQGAPIFENGALTPGVPGSVSVAPSGCDELGKIIPPTWAVSNKALAFSLQQVSGIASLTLPELASILTA